MGLGNFLGGLVGGATTETIKGASDVVLTSAERIKTLVTGVLPPSQQAEFDMEYAKLQTNANLAQTEINKIDAASGKFFQAGWRPALGWTCNISVFCYYVPRAVLGAYIYFSTYVSTGQIIAYPEMGISDILGLLGLLLGFGGMRMWEKSKGTQGNHF